MKQTRIAAGMAALLAATALAENSDFYPSSQLPGMPAGNVPPAISSAQTEKAFEVLPISGDTREIQAYLAKLTNETIQSRHPVERVTDLLCKADRQRLGQDLQKTYPELEKTIAQFRQVWREKYHDGFDIRRADREVAFATGRVLEGDITDQAILASEVLGPGATPRTGFEATDKTMDKSGRETKLATVFLPAAREQRLQAVTLRLADEGTLLSDWRLNCPDTLTAQRLHDNLNARLGALIRSQETWPAESRDALRVVSHEILSAIADQPMVPAPLDRRQTGLDVED